MSGSSLQSAIVKNGNSGEDVHMTCRLYADGDKSAVHDNSMSRED